MNRYFIFSTIAFSLTAGQCAEAMQTEQTKATTSKLDIRNSIYLSFQTGANFLHVEKSESIKIKPNVGYMLGSALGYRWHKVHMRVEEQFLYRHNGASLVNFLGQDVKACGSVSSWSLLTNALYEIPFTFSRCKIAAYLGGGIGYSNQHANACPYVLSNHGRRGGFAWQAIAGFQHLLSSAFEIAVEYRFHQGQAGFLYDNTLDFSFTYHF